MSASFAKRTAAMMEAAITNVEAKRSCIRLSCSSLAIALCISPMACVLAQLLGDQAVRLAEKHFTREVLSTLTAQGAVDYSGLEGKGLNSGWHISLAELASDYKLSSLHDWEAECHSRSIGEIKAKICTGYNSGLFKKSFQRLSIVQPDFGLRDSDGPRPPERNAEDSLPRVQGGRRIHCGALSANKRLALQPSHHRSYALNVQIKRSKAP